MQLNRIIELHEPGPEIRGETGSITYGPSTVHTAWAHRIDQAGHTGIAFDTLVSEFPVKYTIRAEGMEELTTRWTVVEDGKTYRIESFFESTRGRGQYLVLVCAARQ